MANQIISIISNIAIALAGGIIPILIWLWFWEHEDKNPEPHKLTLYAFLGGMAAVILVVPFEEWANTIGLSTIGVYVAWAVIEESVKLLLAYLIVIRRAENDEPIDSVMYLIVTALGFSALENALYILVPVFHGQTAFAINTINLRFLGATIVHAVCSSIVGFGLAFAFYKSNRAKWICLIIALCIAIVLHSLFNLSIILYIQNTGVYTLYAVWLSLVLVLLIFEKIKQITKSVK